MIPKQGDFSRASFRPARGPRAFGRAGADLRQGCPLLRETGEEPGWGGVGSGASPGDLGGVLASGGPWIIPRVWTPHGCTQYFGESGYSPYFKSGLPQQPRVPAVTVSTVWPCACLGPPGPQCGAPVGDGDSPELTGPTRVPEKMQDCRLTRIAEEQGLLYIPTITWKIPKGLLVVT